MADVTARLDARRRLAELAMQAARDVDALELQGGCLIDDIAAVIESAINAALLAEGAAGREEPEESRVWTWQCGDCNAWTINEGRGQYECGHCHTIKPMKARLLLYHYPLPTRVHPRETRDEA